MGIESTYDLQVTDALNFVRQHIRTTPLHRVKIFSEYIFCENAAEATREELFDRLTVWADSFDQDNWDALSRFGDALDVFIPDRFANFLVYPDDFELDDNYCYSPAHIWDRYMAEDYEE